jgi:hypothetical protein
MSMKGTWQRLEINFTCDSLLPPVYLYWSNEGALDFDEMKGHVIFAHPEYLNTSEESTLPGPGETEKLQMSGAFMDPFRALYFISMQTKDRDPIRNIVGHLIDEDTLYHHYSADLYADTLQEYFYSPRFQRWQFGSEIFIKEYNWRQRIIGGGFNYINWYGYYFWGDRQKSDWPHNPFLSLLLYSGIIGLLLYVFLICLVIRHYLRFIREYYMVFVFFCITFLFSFFSSNSPFDPPVLGFFMILPFFIYSSIKNANKEKQETI